MPCSIANVKYKPNAPGPPPAALGLRMANFVELATQCLIRSLSQGRTQVFEQWKKEKKMYLKKVKNVAQGTT